MGVIALSTGHIPVAGSGFYLHLSAEPASPLEAWLYITMAIPFAMMPILQATGTIQYYYETNSKYVRAKSETIFGALCVPAIVVAIKLFRGQAGELGVSRKTAGLFAFVLIIHYAICLFKTIRGPDKQDDT